MAVTLEQCRVIDAAHGLADMDDVLAVLRSRGLYLLVWLCARTPYFIRSPFRICLAMQLDDVEPPPKVLCRSFTPLLTALIGRTPDTEHPFTTPRTEQTLREPSLPSSTTVL